MQTLDQTHAIVLEAPGRLSLSPVSIVAPDAADAVIDVLWSGISSGTERLLWDGRMPTFPGMGYPLVPGYETVGRVAHAPDDSALKPGDHVFVPGARCFPEIRCLFGGSAQRIVVPAARATRIDAGLGADGVLFALAATAYHAMEGATPPDLIVGHGALGRLLARITLAKGAPAPTVWERNSRRMDGATGYAVVNPDDDARRDYRAIYDVSGDGGLLDTLIGRLGAGGEIVLAGFYDTLSFHFAPAFMREARLRIAAEFKPADMIGVQALVEDGRLSLAGLVTHSRPSGAAGDAYDTAFGDADCLKMVLDWSDRA